MIINSRAEKRNIENVNILFIFSLKRQFEHFRDQRTNELIFEEAKAG